MKITDLEELKDIAREIKRGIIEGVYNAQSGHPGGSLSIADIITVLYFNEMNINSENPKDENRDRLVLSKGHCAPALYSALANRGFFEIEELKTLRNIESITFTSKEEIRQELTILANGITTINIYDKIAMLCFFKKSDKFKLDFSRAEQTNTALNYNPVLKRMRKNQQDRRTN